MCFTVIKKFLAKQGNMKHLCTAPNGASGEGLCGPWWGSGFYPGQKGLITGVMCTPDKEGTDGLRGSRPAQRLVCTLLEAAKPKDLIRRHGGVEGQLGEE